MEREERRSKRNLVLQPIEYFLAPSYNERKNFFQYKQLHGRKIEVTFKDGEVLVNTTVGYTPNRRGFFIFPADPKSNNLMVFVISAAVKKFGFYKEKIYSLCIQSN
jgi:hypothetical protein